MLHSTLGQCEEISDCSYTGQTFLQKRNINNVSQLDQGTTSEEEAELEEGSGKEQFEDDRETEKTKKSVNDGEADSDQEEPDSHLKLPRLTEDEATGEKARKVCLRKGLSTFGTSGPYLSRPRMRTKNKECL